MVLVDIRETPSGRAADVFLQIRPGKDFEVLTTLRALIKDAPLLRDCTPARTHRIVSGFYTSQAMELRRP